MKVWALIHILQEVDSDREVFVSKDEEGNLFNPLVDVTDVYMDSFHEPTDSLSGTPAVILWP